MVVTSAPTAPSMGVVGAPTAPGMGVISAPSMGVAGAPTAPSMGIAGALTAPSMGVTRAPAARSAGVSGAPGTGQRPPPPAPPPSRTGELRFPPCPAPGRALFPVVPRGARGPPGHRPPPAGPGPGGAAAAMSEPLGWCVEAVRAAAEPGLARALLALRTRHTRRPGGAARFRERGGLGPLLELLGPERPRRTLDLALSVLGNCCTEPGCRRQARRLGGVPRLVALLSSPGPESVQNRVARTLANLALEPDGARDVLDAGAGPLLVSLAASCGTPECLHSAARALRILGAAPAPRRALGRAGAVRALASRLASLSPAHPACPAVARALRGLTDSPGPSADDVAPALPALAALAAHAKRDHRQPALGAIANACARAPLRPALGAAGAVEAVAEEVRRALASPNVTGATVAVRALCLLCREAVNRVRVRAAGGLGLLLRLLAEPRARPWRPRVLLALAAFAYDQEALVALEARGLVPLLADVLRARADEEEEEEEEEDEEEDEEEEDEAAASCDLPRESWLLSEAGDPWLPEAPALLLLGRLAAADEPSRALATAPVVSGLLRYLTGVPAPAPRAARVLQRLTGHPAFLGALVRAYIPSLLRSWLVLGLAPSQAEELSRPGGPRRTAAPPHPRQARLKELGEGLLRNLGAAAAAPFGVGLLTHMLRCGAPPARLACATALPLLTRYRPCSTPVEPFSAAPPQAPPELAHNSPGGPLRVLLLSPYVPCRALCYLYRPYSVPVVPRAPQNQPCNSPGGFPHGFLLVHLSPVLIEPHRIPVGS
uniref:Armadillo repeat containing 5 n=1 Tax=Strix occidentalis caurina TaxID=311401 RepID=A0A8D0FY34_STROC